jgi:hypothetical protein
LRAVLEAGGEISAESRGWFDYYATDPECRAAQDIEKEFGGKPAE